MDNLKVFRLGFLGLILSISACGKNGTDPGDGPGDGTGVPAVISTSPAGGSTGVHVNASMIITFSVPMDGPAAGGGLVRGSGHRRRRHDLG